jgi:hypothetical protein
MFQNRKISRFTLLNSRLLERSIITTIDGRLISNQTCRVPLYESPGSSCEQLVNRLNMREYLVKMLFIVDLNLGSFLVTDNK